MESIRRVYISLIPTESIKTTKIIPTRDITIASIAEKKIIGWQRSLYWKMNSVDNSTPTLGLRKKKNILNGSPQERFF